MDFNTIQLLHRCHREFSREALRAQGWSETEYSLCAYISDHEDCSQEEASRALRIDKTTVAKALSMLERKGCVERTSSDVDRRRKTLRLTAEGRGKLSGLTEQHRLWFAGISDVLTAEEQMQFENNCLRLLEAAAKLLEEKEPTADDPVQK